MTSTNRALNRLFLFLVGVVLIVFGAAAAVLALVPGVREGWDQNAPLVQEQTGVVLDASEALPGLSWISIGVVLVLVVLIVLLFVFMLRQGHGRTHRSLRDDTTPNGVTVVDAKVAESLLHDALDEHPALISNRVSTYEVKGTPTLDVGVTARRGVSPKDVAVAVESSVRALDDVLGREIPVYLHITGGFRARTTAGTRLQ